MTQHAYTSHVVPGIALPYLPSPPVMLYAPQLYLHCLLDTLPMIPRISLWNISNDHGKSIQTPRNHSHH